MDSRSVSAKMSRHPAKVFRSAAKHTTHTFPTSLMEIWMGFYWQILVLGELASRGGAAWAMVAYAFSKYEVWPKERFL